MGMKKKGLEILAKIASIDEKRAEGIASEWGGYQPKRPVRK